MRIPFINRIPFITRISHLDKLLFAKHLAVMIKAGLPLREGVTTIQEQTKSRRFKKILSDIIKRLDNGEPLGKSLAKHPQAFDDLFINIINTGEASGNLEENLGYLATQLEKSSDLTRKVFSAMIYPAIILVSTFGLGGVLSVFVLPKLIPLFESLDVKLPLATRILLWIVKSIQNHGFFILLGIIAFVVFNIFIFRLKTVKLANHKIILKLPIAGKISQNINLALFSRTLGTLIKSGISIIDALEITAGIVGNLVYQNQLKEISLGVQKGEQMSVYLKSRKKFFPSTFSRMIEVGEKTGSLEESLLYLAEFYEKEVDDTVKKLSIILEPILLIFVGFVVGFIAIAIISPIYQLTKVYAET